MNDIIIYLITILILVISCFYLFHYNQLIKKIRIKTEEFIIKLSELESFKARSIFEKNDILFEYYSLEIEKIKMKIELLKSLL